MNSPKNPKDIIGATRPPLSTVPMPVVFEIGVALLEGACKYGRHNYRAKGVQHSIYYDACMRHLAAWWEGEDVDPDSGLHHVVKALACLTVLRDSMHQANDIDDRPPQNNKDWMNAIRSRVTEVLARHPDPKPPYVRDNTDWIERCRDKFNNVAVFTKPPEPPELPDVEGPDFNMQDEGRS